LHGSVVLFHSTVSSPGVALVNSPLSSWGIYSDLRSYGGDCRKA
jgi:hypothetical protein